jgi:hypothetical protein
MVAGRWGKEILDGLVVMGCPHVGILLTNQSDEQNRKFEYMKAHQVRKGWA